MCVVGGCLRRLARGAMERESSEQRIRGGHGDRTGGRLELPRRRGVPAQSGEGTCRARLGLASTICKARVREKHEYLDTE